MAVPDEAGRRPDNGIRRPSAEGMAPGANDHASSDGADVVARAMALRRAHPEWPALQVLDNALEHCRNTYPCFECDEVGYDDYLEPPSPFAELVRQAFAPDIAPGDLALMADFHAEPTAGARVLAIEASWLEATRRFSARYRLWPGAAVD